LNSPPTVVGDIAIVGAAFTPFAPAKPAQQRDRLHPRYDVVTGRLLWTFHTIRGATSPASRRGSTVRPRGRGRRQRGRLGHISRDPQLGLAYLPVESPYGDMYGGLRPGANLYGESIVAVDLKTGKRRWHFQTCIIRSGTTTFPPLRSWSTP
jgi:quinoprotein glucose dehydrogenase